MLNINSHTIKLTTGELTVKADNELLRLAGFGSRANEKRGFVFVSKVLGKHVAVVPSAMDAVATTLANLARAEIAPSGPVVVIGFAETATGLGNCIYERLETAQSFYIHTTRYKLSSPMLLEFSEEHCHAPSHYLYAVRDEALKNILRTAETVVLVDDEITTGNTIRNIVLRLRETLPRVKRYVVASYLNWMREPINGITFVSLISGEVHFRKGNVSVAHDFTSVCRHDGYMDAVVPHNFGRFGVRRMTIDGGAVIAPVQWAAGARVLVLGTGEFMYVPFLLARWLEQSGVDVYYQSTTRSPLNVDGDIKSAIRFKDNYGEDIDNFLYNVTPGMYDVILICYETPTIADNHALSDILRGYAPEVREVFITPGDNNTSGQSHLTVREKKGAVCGRGA
ncbi:MAG: phosphoribosyltransferase family protein, partial [Nitrospirae bacterium]|nr:phosphoribosyltransferase family protein [Nitrospirota bacterium]